MHTTRRLVYLGVLIVGATLVLAGCSSSFQGVACEFTVHNVHESTGSPGYIDVKATGSCSGAADQTVVTIGIERLVNGSWTYVTGSNATRTIKPVAANVTYTVMSSKYIRCTPGTYHGVASGTLTVGGVTSQQVRLGKGSDVYVDCK
jgi:hypothetical protein